VSPTYPAQISKKNALTTFWISPVKHRKTVNRIKNTEKQKKNNKKLSEKQKGFFFQATWNLGVPPIVISAASASQHR